jgi:hypothetical protein
MAENDWTNSQQGTQNQAAQDAANGFVRNVQNLPNDVQQNYINSHPGTKK